jgi:hypothetical protein
MVHVLGATLVWEDGLEPLSRSHPKKALTKSIQTPLLCPSEYQPSPGQSTPDW